MITLGEMYNMWELLNYPEEVDKMGELSDDERMDSIERRALFFSTVTAVVTVLESGTTLEQLREELAMYQGDIEFDIADLKVKKSGH